MTPLRQTRTPWYSLTDRDTSREKIAGLFVRSCYFLLSRFLLADSGQSGWSVVTLFTVCLFYEILRTHSMSLGLVDTIHQLPPRFQRGS